MNEQLIQLILYSHILATQGGNVQSHLVPVLNAEILKRVNLPAEAASHPEPDSLVYGDFPPPLTQKELLDVIVKTIADVLTLYTNTTIPVGTAGVLPVTAVLKNLTSL